MNNKLLQMEIYEIRYNYYLDPLNPSCEQTGSANAGWMIKNGNNEIRFSTLEEAEKFIRDNKFKKELNIILNE